MLIRGYKEENSIRRSLRVIIRTYLWGWVMVMQYLCVACDGDRMGIR